MRARIERGQTVVRAVLLVAAVGLVGVLLYRQVARLSTPKVTVWVAATDLGAGQSVSASRLKAIQAPPAKGALADRSSIEGRVLKVAKPAGQPFYPADLQPRQALPALSTTIPVGRLLATVKIQSFDMPTSELRQGDRLDLIQAGPEGVKMIAHDAYLMGNLRSAAPPSSGNKILGVDLTPPSLDKPTAPAAALVLAVFPEDVYPLAAAEQSGEKIKIVLHSDAEVKSGVLLTPDPPKPEPPGEGLPAVELIAGKTKETVYAADEVRRIAYAPPRRPSPTPTPRASASRQ